MSYQVFSDMDGVLVNFEGGVLKFMNQRFQELKDQPDHPDYKLARSAAKEIGGWMSRLTSGILLGLIKRRACPGTIGSETLCIVL